MQIETYEIEEVKGEMGNLAADSEACELIKTLGLEGQQSLVDGKTDTRFPYPEMSKKEHFVYGNTLPIRTDVSKYNAGIIPLRVLQIIAYAKTVPMITGLEIWHPESAKEDPLLVGKAKHENGYSTIFYVLARWGDTLLPFASLEVKAKAAYKAKLINKLKAIKTEVDGALTRVEDIVNEKLESGENSLPTFYSL